MEISKHPEMGNIVASIRKIADEFPCEDCKALRDDLNASKSRMTHWKEKYDTIKETISEIINEFNAYDGDDGRAVIDFFDRIKNTIEEV